MPRRRRPMSSVANASKSAVSGQFGVTEAVGRHARRGHRGRDHEQEIVLVTRADNRDNSIRKRARAVSAEHEPSLTPPFGAKASARASARSACNGPDGNRRCHPIRIERALTVRQDPPLPWVRGPYAEQRRILNRARRGRPAGRRSCPAPTNETNVKSAQSAEALAAVFARARSGDPRSRSPRDGASRHNRCAGRTDRRQERLADDEIARRRERAPQRGRIAGDAVTRPAVVTSPGQFPVVPGAQHVRQRRPWSSSISRTLEPATCPRRFAKPCSM